ncbi:hypothetical protein PO883_22785 [Massilia sp. DJPM01]|uniref:hypothetical protein n=1 Tax=Massilia sp. DJPM01 TaxID=3024404 RepID=UPI00259D6736|nr:hypothetical protein [Massilia sp. DJPM01]MDM5180019.1 hypothetical protein [Massilia sp. DJPM01]
MLQASGLSKLRGHTQLACLKADDGFVLEHDQKASGKHFLQIGRTGLGAMGKVERMAVCAPGHDIGVHGPVVITVVGDDADANACERALVAIGPFLVRASIEAGPGVGDWCAQAQPVVDRWSVDAFDIAGARFAHGPVQRHQDRLDQIAGGAHRLQRGIHEIATGEFSVRRTDKRTPVVRRHTDRAAGGGRYGKYQHRDQAETEGGVAHK